MIGQVVDPLKDSVTDDTLNSLFEAVQLMRLLDREFPAQMMAMLLYIASHNGCHKQAVEQALGISTAAGSHASDALSDRHRLGKPGLGLIKKVEDPSNRRRKFLVLTEKGKLLVNQLKQALES